MSARKVGALIKEARTEAGMTQEQLARKVRDCSAADISKAERGEKALTQDQLKAIAKATDVTQKSLLDAAKGTSSSSRSGGTSTAAKSSMQVTTTERRLVEKYRNADSATKKQVMSILSGTDLGTNVMDAVGDALSDMVGDFLKGGRK